MKRFTSIICALSLVLSLTAATPFHSTVPAKNESAKLEKVLKSAKNDKERKDIIKRYKAVHEGQVSVLKAQTSAKKARAPKAKREATSVVITRVSTTLYAEEGTIYYGLHTDDFAPAFYFEIPVAAGTHDVEIGRVYTLANMNASSCEWDDEEWDAHYYAEATFQKTIGSAYDVHIVAAIKDVDGVEWNLSYDETPLVPTGETINVAIERAIESLEYISSDGSWLIRARNNNYFVQLQYYSEDTESPVGTFDGTSIILGDTYIEMPTGELDDYDDPIYKAVHPKNGSISVVASNEGKRIDVTASLLCEDGNVYAITLFYALPEKKSEAQLVATNLNVDDWALEWWGEVGLYASNDDGLSIGLSLYPEDTENWFTTYELSPDSRHSGYIAYNEQQFNIYTGSITVAYENDKYVITGTVLAWDNVEYTLNLSSPDPVITPMTFNGSSLVLDTYEDRGAWQIAGFDDAHENFLSIAVYSTEVAGHYTDTAVFEARATYLAVGETIYLLQSSDITVTHADGEATVSGTLLLVNQEDQLDLIELTLDVAAGPYQPAVHNINISDFMFSYYDDGPDVYYEMLEENKQQEFAFDLMVGRWEADVEFGKTYTLNDMLEADSYGLNYYENTYIVYSSVSFVKNKVDDQVTFTITVLDTRGNTWNISYAGEDKEIDPINVTLGQCNMFAHSESAIEYEMVDRDNSLKCVLVLNLTDDVESDSTYTTETIDLVDSYLSVLGTEYSLTDATFKKEVDGDAQSVRATITDERGYRFILSFYDDGFRPTGDTLTVEADAEISVTYWEEYYQWNIYAENDSLIVSFSIDGDENAFDVDKELAGGVSVWNSRIEFNLGYDEEDQVDKWQYIQLRKVYSLVITGEENSYTLEAIVLAEDGNVYEITINQLPEAIDTIHTESVAVKRIVNGQFFIEKNGVRYNAVGAIVR